MQQSKEHEDKVAKLMMEGYSDFEILKRMGVDSFERRYAYKQTFDFLTKGKASSSSFFFFDPRLHASDYRKKNATRNRFEESLCKGAHGTQR